MTILWILVVALASAPSSIDIVKTKFHKMEVGAYAPGSRVPIYLRDLNPYLNSIIQLSVPAGLRNVRLETGTNNIIRGTADIDFVKIRQARGEAPSWLMSQLMGGERPVEITARLTSAHGVAKVDVLKVSISGVVAEGRMLDFLITTFVVPNFPDAKIGTDFRLDYNIDHFYVQPGVVTVVLKR
jgi:hypothetical protein